VKLEHRSTVGIIEMNDVVNPGHTPADEDPVLHGLLASLPQPQPSHNLEDRVLSGVFRPAPRWFRRARTAWVGLNESGRIWVIVGSLAAGSVLPLAALAVGTRLLGSHTQHALGFTTTEILPYLRASFEAQAASLLETFRGPIGIMELVGSQWAGWSVTVAMLCVGCSWGLHRTMTPRAARK
jgi:hypothetical protein